MIKKIKYIFYLLPLIFQIKNIFSLINLFLLKKAIILKVRPDYIFYINHPVDLVTIKEVIIDKVYKLSIKQPKIIVDIGANIGTFSIFSSIIYPESKIFAIEPSSSTFEIFKKNLNLNHTGNVYPINIGIGSKNERRILYTTKASGLTSLYNFRKNTIPQKVKIINLDSLFKMQKILKCDLLKIDAEGAEYEILLSCPSDTLKKINNIVLEYHNLITNNSINSLVNFLKSGGFKINIVPNVIEKGIGVLYASRK